MLSSFKKRVLMLVNNPATHDTRVIKYAESLSANGYEITVLCRKNVDTPDNEVKNGVTYKRVDYCYQPNLLIKKLLRFFLRHPRRISALPISTVLTLILISPILLLPFIFKASILLLSVFLESIIYAAKLLVKLIGSLIQLLKRTLLLSLRIAFKAVNVLRMTINYAKYFIRKVVTAIKKMESSLVSQGNNYYQTIKNIKNKIIRKLEYILFLTPLSLFVNKYFKTLIISLESYVSLYDEVIEQDFDLIHTHDLDTLTVASMAAKLKAKPLIYDVHEYECDRNDRLGFFNKAFASNEQGKYIKNTSVVTVSRGISERLSSDYSINKPLVIYNSPLIPKQGISDMTSGNIREKLGISNDQFIVVYVGLVTEDRCLDKMIQAMEYTSYTHFVLVGPHNPPTVEKLKILAQEINREDFLHILPPVPYNEVTSFVRTADIGIALSDKLCFSYEYAMPNKFFEMTLAGLPLVISHQQEMNDFVSKHNNGLILNNNSPKEIARGVEEVLDNIERYKPNAIQLQKLIESYSWKAQENKIFDLYEHVV